MVKFLIKKMGTFVLNFICSFFQKNKMEGDGSGGGGGDSPPKPSLSEYIGLDRISFVMFLLRIYTLYAGLMATINPYR